MLPAAETVVLFAKHQTLTGHIQSACRLIVVLFTVLCYGHIILKVLIKYVKAGILQYKHYYDYRLIHTYDI